MESDACSELPNEIIERVLSFLPVPSLCRFRTVCKTWNDLTRKPAFHDVCDLIASQKHSRYLFVTRYLMYWWTDPERILWLKFVDALRRPLSILDLETNRWYTIPAEVYSRGAATEDFGSRLLAVDDGLICELTGKEGLSLVISDLVAATRRQLPPSPVYWKPNDEPLPVVATAVDPVSRTYRVVVVSSDDDYPQYNHACVYESATNRWHDVNRLCMKAVSAVFFRNVLYGVYESSTAEFLLQTPNLNPQDDHQRPGEGRTLGIPPCTSVVIPRHPVHPRLVVSGGRLCMMQWLPSASQSPCHPYANFGRAQSTSILEVLEIVVDSELHRHDTRSLVQMTMAQLREWFGEESIHIACAIPMFQEDGSGDCQSVVLMSEESGKIVRRDLVSGAVEVMPAHPFGPVPTSSPLHPDRVPVHSHYVGKLANLSLRSLTL